MSKFMKKPTNGGYNHQYRLEVLKSVLKAYKVILAKDRSGEVPMYRSWDYDREERDIKKAKKVYSWYKSGGRYDSVMMVPATGSELRRGVEERLTVDDKVRVVEMTGERLVSVLKRVINSGEKVMCAREDCLLCCSEGRGSCSAARVVYEIKCKECDKTEFKAVYVGETARTAYPRGKEHVDNRDKEESMMRKHEVEVHGGDMVD